jgi:hypothetical protein
MKELAGNASGWRKLAWRETAFDVQAVYCSSQKTRNDVLVTLNHAAETRQGSA